MHAILYLGVTLFARNLCVFLDVDGLDVKVPLGSKGRPLTKFHSNHLPPLEHTSGAEI